MIFFVSSVTYCDFFVSLYIFLLSCSYWCSCATVVEYFLAMNKLKSTVNVVSSYALVFLPMSSSKPPSHVLIKSLRCSCLPHQSCVVVPGVGWRVPVANP